MARVLQLLPHDGDLQYRRSLATLRDGSPPGDMETRTIGRGGDYRNLFWAVLGLRKLARQFDLIHAWDERGVVAAALSGMSKIIFTAPPKLSRRGPAILRRVARRSELHIVASTPTQHSMLIANGLSPDRCQLIRPPAKLDNGGVARASLREQLGIRDDDFVILAPGESTRASAHERAVWTGSILHVVDERYRVLLWGRGARIDTAAGLGTKLHQKNLVIVAERALGREVEFDNLLCAADALLVCAEGATETLAVALAMKAGVPIVAARNPHLAELLIDDSTAMTVATPSPRAMAQRILDLQADASQRQRITANAKQLADKLFSPAQFLNQYCSLYENGSSASAS